MNRTGQATAVETRQTEKVYEYRADPGRIPHLETESPR